MIKSVVIFYSVHCKSVVLLNMSTSNTSRVRGSNIGVTRTYGTVITLVMHLVGKVFTLEIKTASGSGNIDRMTGSDRLGAYRSPNNCRRKIKITDLDTQIQCQ